MTSMQRLIGLPVIIDGRKAGHVLHGVLDKSGESLSGILVRNGIRGARWISSEQIKLLGGVSVLATGKPAKPPANASFSLGRVRDTAGLRLGAVTDALVCEETLRVAALEISGGPIDDLLSGRRYVTRFSVSGQGEVTISQEESEVKEQ